MTAEVSPSIPNSFSEIEAKAAGLFVFGDSESFLCNSLGRAPALRCCHWYGEECGRGTEDWSRALALKQICESKLFQQSRRIRTSEVGKDCGGNEVWKFDSQIGIHVILGFSFIEEILESWYYYTVTISTYLHWGAQQAL